MGSPSFSESVTSDTKENHEEKKSPRKNLVGAVFFRVTRDGLSL